MVQTQETTVFSFEIHNLNRKQKMFIQKVEAVCAISKEEIDFAKCYNFNTNNNPVLQALCI